MNILTLYFIRDESRIKPREKRMPIKKTSKTQKRNMKRLRKIKNKMQVDSGVKGQSTEKTLNHN
jgi:hypothetical protein